MSRGRGIFIIRQLSELQYDTNSVVQEYISRPYLICGYKFDMRLYVAVLSYHPLVIYLYNDGLVRFSCEKYDLSSLGNVYSHLTNTSINKFSSSYAIDKVGIGHGSKWTIKQLRHYFHQRHIDDEQLWWKVISIINLTIIPQVPEIPDTENCFELYGFDILVDSNMKPWLLEVNFSPSLSVDCAADIVKRSMLSDLVDLLQYQPNDVFQGEDSFIQKTSRPPTTLTKQSERPATNRSLNRKSSMARGRARVTSTTHLPSIRSSSSFRKQNLCTSSHDLNDSCTSDDEDSEFSPPTNSILSCSLSHGSLPSASMSSIRAGGGTSMASRASTGVRPKTKAKRIPLRPMTRGVNENSILTHNKPWRQEKGSLKIKCYNMKASEPALGSQPVVGGFHRIYPFNQQTKSKTLSPRQMVVETTQMIRNQISKSRTIDEPSRSSRTVVRHDISIIQPFNDLKCA